MYKEKELHKPIYNFAYTDQSWRSNEELIRYIHNKPDATDDEKLLAYRLERKMRSWD
jgi:hypothetical protein